MQIIHIKRIKHPYSKKKQLIGCMITNTKNETCVITEINDSEVHVKTLLREDLMGLLNSKEKAFIGRLMDKYGDDITFQRDKRINTELDFYLIGHIYP